MTSLRSHIADVARKERRFREVIGVEPNYEDFQLAAALLADPTLAAIIDTAAEHFMHFYDDECGWDGVPPTVAPLLAAWRAER